MNWSLAGKWGWKGREGGSDSGRLGAAEMGVKLEVFRVSEPQNGRGAGGEARLEGIFVEQRWRSEEGRDAKYRAPWG